MRDARLSRAVHRVTMDGNIETRGTEKKNEKISNAFSRRRIHINVETTKKKRAKRTRQNAHLIRNKHRYEKSRMCLGVREYGKNISTCITRNVCV